MTINVLVMEMIKRKELNVAVLELLSNILGDTTDGLTGTEIHRFLLQAGISDISENDTFYLNVKDCSMLLLISKIPKNVVITY